MYTVTDGTNSTSFRTTEEMLRAVMKTYLQEMGCAAGRHRLQEMASSVGIELCGHGYDFHFSTPKEPRINKEVK